MPSVLKDRRFLESLGKSDKITATDSEIKAVTERYEKNRLKLVGAFKRIRESLISRGNKDLANARAKEVIKNSRDQDLPRGKEFYEEGLKDLYRISNNSNKTLGQLIYVKDRASALPPTRSQPGKINVGKKEVESQDMRSLWHEFGHHVELSNPYLKEVFKGWVLSGSGGEIKSLREITGNQKYGKDEVAYVGKFGLGAYVGRVYPDGSTEVLSKGLERFSDISSMINFFQKDPEHFLMIVGILDSL